MKDIHRLNIKGWKKYFHAHGNGENAGIATLIYDKIEFKTKTIIWDKEHYIMTKGATQQGAPILVNMYVPNIG